MSDQCKNCTLRGNMKNCRQTPCNIRESWFAIEIEKAAQDEIDRLDTQKMELEGQVAMLRDAVQRIVNDACAYDCHYPPYLDRPLSATAQTAEEYRKRVQAEAIDKAVFRIVMELEGLATESAMNQVYRTGRNIAAELSNPAAQAESGSVTFQSTGTWSGTAEGKE